MTCILVMGTGRSGTSAIAGILHKLGVNMGSQFVETLETNPYGTYENIEFRQEISERLIKGELMIEAAIPQIKQFSERQQGLWGLKDPYLCKIAHHLAEFLDDYKIIVAQRDTAEVIDSFRRAYSVNQEIAQQWYENVSSNLNWQLSYLDIPKLTINYSDLMKDTEAQVKRIAEFVGVDVTQEALDHIRPKPTVGIAMIVRNAEGIMERALMPFIGQVDEIAIILGGKSTDRTAEIARRYTPLVAEFEGNLSDDGLLLDFAAARQQAADMLSTDWMLSVDADDIWQRGQNLSKVIAVAESHNAGMVFIPYYIKLSDGSSSQFTHSRLFRRNTGRWVGPIHETWIPDNGYQAIGNDLMSITQDKSQDATQRQLNHNLVVLEKSLSEEYDHRLQAHLVQDYAATNQSEKALIAAAKYLEMDIPDKRNDDQFYYVCYIKSVLLYKQQDYFEAIKSALMALSVANYGRAWTLLAACAAEMSNTVKSPEGLCEFANLMASQALTKGKDRAMTPANLNDTLILPHIIKAKTFKKLNRPKDALASVDSVLMLQPDNAEMKKLQTELCNKLQRMI